VTTEADAAPVADRAKPRPVTLARWVSGAIRTARPRQWPKNLLVFAAPLAGHSLGPRNGNGLADAIVAAFAFGFASAAVYYVNDVADVERDRAHPTKRNRPIAAGELPRSHALVLAGCCVAAALAAGFAIGAPLLTATVAGYLASSFSYSMVLKHVPVLEVLFVASGFLLRVLGGAAATHVPPSGWFLLVCSLGALGVAVAKRYTELVTLGPDAIRHRPVMRSYRPAMLRISQYAIGALMIVCYVLWAATEHSGARGWHLASSIPLYLALYRFAVLTGRHTIRPVEDMIIRDGVMLACEVGWLTLFVTGLYVA
jgi:decaprenyl-phosphate phosphoribosyltransferase